MALYHEWRCRGKALYAIPLDSNPLDFDVIGGLDLTNVRPIDLMLKVDSTSPFAHESKLYICFYHDFVVRFTAGVTVTSGSG
jgi:hypothetical protein